MPITTKTGDAGDTSLLYGVRVGKDDLRIEANGILDELSSFLGLSKSLLKGKEKKSAINKIQEHIVAISAEIATEADFLHTLPRKIRKADIRWLESAIEKLEKKRSLKKYVFVMPGRNTLSATLDIARTIARTAERRTIALKNRWALKNRDILVYLNRLSDFLYLLARSYEKR